MSKATVYNTKGEKVKEIDLNPKVFDLKISPELVQQAVVTQQANRRKNLAHTKDKGEVRGGGRKPWRQKGTGRARHGSIRSPLWRGGGITFGPTKDQNFSLKMNKKAKRKAILMVLSDKASRQKIVLLDNLSLEEAKTKKFFEILKNLKLRKSSGNKKALAKDKKETKELKSDKIKAKSVLVILPEKNDKIKRATQNIPKLNTIQANSLNILDILQPEYLLLPLDALTVIEKTFVTKDASLGKK